RLRHRLLAQLDDVRSTLERRFHDARRLDLVAVVTGDHVEAHARESDVTLLSSSHMCCPTVAECSSPFPPQVLPDQVLGSAGRPAFSAFRSPRARLIICCCIGAGPCWRSRTEPRTR